MEKINIALDIFSIIICLILILYLTRKKSAGQENRWFLFACLFNIVMILGDLTDWCCNGLARSWYPAALHIGQFVYYMSIVPLSLSVWKYICSYLSAYMPVPGFCSHILILLSAVHLIGCILTPFTGMYYVITDANIYLRGPLVIVSSLVPICLYILILFLTLKCRRTMAPHVTAALLSYVWIPLLGHLVQNLFRGIGLLNPCITLALLIIFLNIHTDLELQYETNKRELDHLQMTLMLSQIRSHFLYNSLTAIRRLCETDPGDAKAAINDFSLFLRANMDSISYQQPVPFEQELLHTRSYLNLEQRRFDDELTVVYELETTDFCLPALSLQPIVENAVLHGIRKKGSGTVTIHTSENNSGFLVTVSDDGAGFDPEKIADQPNIGLNNVSKRLAILCKGTLHMENVPGSGTNVTIFIPKTKEGIT